MSRYRRRLDPRATASDRGLERELDDEIHAHIEMRTAELIERGMEPEEARAEALRRFGVASGARRRLLSGARRRDRRIRVRAALGTLTSDVRLVARGAKRTPGFALTGVAIFALGVGLTTCMATVADHVLLRPLPYPQPDRLVALWSAAEGGSEFPWVSMGNWADWRESEAIGSSALHAEQRASVATPEDAFHASTTLVAGAFFETLGSAPLVGRTFTEEEAQQGTRVAVVSEGFWRRTLGAAPLPTLPDLYVNGTAYEVVGVMAHATGFPSGTEIWVPFRWSPTAGGSRNNINYRAVARLAPGATIDAAHAELDAIAAHIRTSDAEALYSWGVGVRPLRDVVVGDARTYVVMLTVAVAFLLLVASANLAGLSLARAKRRSREVAVHMSLGAGRGTLVRRAIVEHVVLALVGGAVGIAFARLAVGALMGRVAHVVPRVEEVGFDGRVAALGVTAALLAGLLAGLAPALRGARGDLSTVLSGARGSVRGGRGLPGAVMVGTEVALAVALLVAGGLLVRSFRAVVGTDLGFEPAGVLTGELALVDGRYAEPGRRLLFWEALTNRLEGLPGVTAAAVASAIPTGVAGNGFIDLPGREGEKIGAGYRAVSERYFEVLGIRLVAGRAFQASDATDGERVTIVSRSMAARYWPDSDPLGQRVRARSMEGAGRPAPWLTVVGVVDDVRQFGFESDVRPDMYVLYRQVPYYTRGMTVIARARTGSRVPAAALRSAARDLDPSVAVEASTMEVRLAGLTEERRLVLSGLGVFAAAAVLLVCLGIYGLMSFAAGERTREMAVRVALGERRAGIVRLMLLSTARVLLAGGLAGIGAAWAFTRLLDSLLVDVATTDPVSYAGALALLSSVALLAALGPSVRAARQDPLGALKSEG